MFETNKKMPIRIFYDNLLRSEIWQRICTRIDGMIKGEEEKYWNMQNESPDDRERQYLRVSHYKEFWNYILTIIKNSAREQ